MMGNCIWCGNKGVFLKVDQNNLCSLCQEKIYPDIKNKTEYVSYCYERLKKSTKFDVKMAHLEMLTKTLDELKKYEDKHIPTMVISLDIKDAFSNVKGPIVKVKIDREKEELERKKREELIAVINEYGTKYGKLPEEYLLLESYEDQMKYFLELMEKYKNEGILTLVEIDECIKNRKPFRGVHSKGLLDNDNYRIYVVDTLIYDNEKNYFDSQFKRFSMYSEIQHMIANSIFHRDLAAIRQEEKRAARGRNRRPLG